MSFPKDKKFIRLFFATDVHGSTMVFKKFLNAIDAYHADFLVLGGDVTGKLIIPLLDLADGTYSANFMEQNWIVKREELEAFEQRIENAGFYSLRTTKTDWEEIEKSDQYDNLYEKLAVERVKEWQALAADKFKGSDHVAYITGGNDDPFWFKEAFNGEGKIRNVDEELVDVFGRYQMVSLGYSNRTPWKTPRELDEKDLATKIDGLVSKCTQPHQACIFNFHVPPNGTGLDTCPAVDGSITPPRYLTKGGQIVYIAAGSTAVKESIERFQPALGLHGHIHEQRAATKLGKTWCINPGSEYGEGVLRGVLVNLNAEGKGVTSYQFTAG